MSDVLPAHDSADRLQRSPDESIARRVDGQLVEAAGDQASRQQLMPLGLQYIDAPAHTIQDRLASAVALAEVASLPLLDRARQDFSNQIWQLVGAVLESNLPDSRVRNRSDA